MLMAGLGLARAERTRLAEREFDERQQVGAVGDECAGAVVDGHVVIVSKSCRRRRPDSSSGPGLRPAC